MARTLMFMTLRCCQGIGLAQQLHIHPKALRSALRYLEQEQVVWREHRAFKRRRQGATDEDDGGATQFHMLLLAQLARSSAYSHGEEPARMTRSLPAAVHYLCIQIWGCGTKAARFSQRGCLRPPRHMTHRASRSGVHHINCAVYACRCQGGRVGVRRRRGRRGGGPSEGEADVLLRLHRLRALRRRLPGGAPVQPAIPCTALWPGLRTETLAGVHCSQATLLTS